MKRLAVVLVVCALACLMLPQSGAQSAPQSEAKPTAADLIDEQARIILDVTRVNLLFTVTDKRGRFITDLDRNNFEVWEGKRRQEILEFNSEADLPLRLAILIDTSNSIRDRFKFQQEAAIEFIRSVIRPNQDKAIIVSFDTLPELVADLTDDVQTLENSVRDLRPGGGTSLYDAVFFACRDKLSQDQPRHKFRRAMIILSDGDDNQSRYSRDQALEQAHKADVVIYTISTNITRIESDGDKLLKYFSKQTGGSTYFPFKVEDLSQSFENIANELRHQYAILYKPEPTVTDGQYQTVELRVVGRRDAVPRARQGYYRPRL
jgi:VWFA-related protein